jgi:hypothetical protein
MKKSSFIILAFLASLSLEVCQAQQINLEGKSLPAVDTTVVDENDTVRYYNQQPQRYNYYYRSRLWDNLFRVFFTRRYYTVINRPGYVPRHVRVDRGRSYASNPPGAHHHPVRSHRGGFGHFGSHHSVVG